MVGWSSDGKEMFVRSGTAVPSRIDRVDIETGRRTLLAEVAPADRTGLFFFSPAHGVEGRRAVRVQLQQTVVDVVRRQPAR